MNKKVWKKSVHYPPRLGGVPYCEAKYCFSLECFRGNHHHHCIPVSSSHLLNPLHFFFSIKTSRKTIITGCSSQVFPQTIKMFYSIKFYL